ncbi:amidase family protein [Enterococcus faecalis]
MKKSIFISKLGLLLLLGQALLVTSTNAQENVSSNTTRTGVTAETTGFVETTEGASSSASEKELGTIETRTHTTALAETDGKTQQTTFSSMGNNTDKQAVPDEQATFTETEYKHASASELAQLVRNKKVTSEELVKLAVAIIKRKNPALNAVITLREAAAITEAQSLEDHGQPFLGVPLLLKGLGQSLKGESNTNGLGFMKDQVSGATSTFVKALQNAGFIIIGQTNYPELGWKNISDSSLYGVSVNPWNLHHYSGGSSGGAGASVAAAFVPIASGSDAGGSIRIPASWTGTVGFKPSRGVIAGNSNSTKGQTVHFGLSKTVADTKALFESLVIKDIPVGHLSKAQPIAYTIDSPVGTPVSADAKEAVSEAVAFLKEQGYTLVEVKHPVDGRRLMKNYYTIAAGSAGIADFLARQQLKRSLQRQDVELLTWALYQTGKNLTSADTSAAWADVALQAQQMTAFYRKYPIFLTPTTADTAPDMNNPLLKPELAAQMERTDQIAPAAQQQLIYDQWLTALTYTPFTQQANLFGHPALSVPTYVSRKGLPLGVQFNAATNEDRTLLQLGLLFEQHHKINVLHANPPEPKPETEDSGMQSSKEITEHSDQFTSSNNAEHFTTGLTSDSTKEKTATALAENTINTRAKLPKTGAQHTLESWGGVAVVSIVVILVGCLRKNQKKNI